MKLVVASFVIIIIYMVQKRLYCKLWKKNLKISLQFDKNYIESGECATFIETINNNKFLPLPVLHIKFAIDRSFIFSDMENSVVTDYYHRNDAFSVMSNQRVIRKLEFKGMNRGLYSIENANILVRDFFMTNTFAEIIKNDAEIYVFPKKLYSKELSFVYSGLIGEIKSRQSLLNDNISLKGVREYQPFDVFRTINWKNSAKLDKLMVNQFENTRDVSVRILLNLDTDSMIKIDRLLEESISLASTLTRLFLKDKISVSISSNGTDITSKSPSFIRAGQDLSHSITVDKYLSRIYSSLGAEYFMRILDEEIENKDTSVTYIIISPYHKKDILDKTNLMISKGMSANMIVPYYDKIGYEPEAKYIKGWEVHLDEA